MEAARAAGGEGDVDALYTEWGRTFFDRRTDRVDAFLGHCLANCGLDAGLVRAADDEQWDTPIVEAMEVAYAFGGPKTQTPTIVVHTDPPHGLTGPVMAPPPPGDAAPPCCLTAPTVIFSDPTPCHPPYRRSCRLFSFR